MARGSRNDKNGGHEHLRTLMIYDIVIFIFYAIFYTISVDGTCLYNVQLYKIDVLVILCSFHKMNLDMKFGPHLRRLIENIVSIA